jgi:hypothetical protein
MTKVYEVWDTDTYNLLGAYVGKERAENCYRLFEKQGRRPNIKDTGMTKQEYSANKKGML